MNSSKLKNNESNKKNRFLKLAGLASIVIIVAIVALIITALTTKVSNGLENLTSGDREIAQRALHFIRTNTGPALIQPVPKVLSVTSAPTEGICNNSFGDPATSTKAQPLKRYEVATEKIWPFGITSDRASFYICEY